LTQRCKKGSKIISAETIRTKAADLVLRTEKAVANLGFGQAAPQMLYA